MGLLQTILATLVTLGVLVTIHEWGHYFVARLCGVKVLRFSVGFGKPLWMRTAEDGTEYAVAAIPLGGYVRMLDEREAPVPDHLKNQAFNNKSVLQRIAIVAAGPLVNLIFAVLAYWALFVSGVTVVKPVIGSIAPGSLAEVAGLQAGSEIVEIDGREVYRLEMGRKPKLEKVQLEAGRRYPLSVTFLQGGSAVVWLEQVDLVGKG
ncbi:MAG: metalloprotease RseP, partial [Pseudomonadota bacterium]